MRPTTAKIDAAVVADVQSPGYLVQLDFSAPIRLCNRGTVVWGGHTWFQGGVSVSNLTTAEGGGKGCVISIPNNAFAFSAVVLGETASGKRVRVWKIFGDAPFSDDDAVLQFDGLIDDVPNLVNEVTLNCSTQNLRTTSIPNVTIGPPYFNNMPRTGQTITWDGEVYELEPR
jgi:hypothetical protein